MNTACFFWMILRPLAETVSTRAVASTSLSSSSSSKTMVLDSSRLLPARLRFNLWDIAVGSTKGFARRTDGMLREVESSNGQHPTLHMTTAVNNSCRRATDRVNPLTFLEGRFSCPSLYGVGSGTERDVLFGSNVQGSYGVLVELRHHFHRCSRRDESRERIDVVCEARGYKGELGA